jgi:hypothetical protein
MNDDKLKTFENGSEILSAVLKSIIDEGIAKEEPVDGVPP